MGLEPAPILGFHDWRREKRGHFSGLGIGLGGLIDTKANQINTIGAWGDFKLTASANATTGGIDIVNGTAGNDTIVGTVDTKTTTNSSLNAGDNITGGAGADLLSVTVVGDGTGSTAVSGITMAGVETLRVINNANNAGAAVTTDFTAAGWAGLTDVNVAGSLSTGNTKVDRKSVV